eukprot:12778491-Alexandrium_andersonii.AAC.1
MRFSPRQLQGMGRASVLERGQRRAGRRIRPASCARPHIGSARPLARSFRSDVQGGSEPG